MEQQQETETATSSTNGGSNNQANTLIQHHTFPHGAQGKTMPNGTPTPAENS